MNLAPGTTYISGQDREMGKRIFEACDNVGVSPRLIRTSDSGFLVPDAVADEVERLGLPEWADKEAVF
jgi:predicted ATP-grasp superfamily ATP-dependent carboligase